MVQSCDITRITAPDNSVRCPDKFREFIGIPGPSLGQVHKATSLAPMTMCKPFLTEMMPRLWLPSPVPRDWTRAVMKAYAIANDFVLCSGSWCWCSQSFAVIWCYWGAIAGAGFADLICKASTILGMAWGTQWSMRLKASLNIIFMRNKMGLFSCYSFAYFGQIGQLPLAAISGNKSEACALFRRALNKHILCFELSIHWTILQSPSSSIQPRSTVCTMWCRC